MISLGFCYIITKIHHPFQNPGSAPGYLRILNRLQVCYQITCSLVNNGLFQTSTGGSVVESSPPTREARLRYPAVHCLIILPVILDKYLYNLIVSLRFSSFLLPFFLAKDFFTLSRIRFAVYS